MPDTAHGADGELAQFVRAHPRLFVLTGAGISTASGIPDYRDDQGQWKRPPPVNVQDFLHSAAARRRYWARSMAGWPKLVAARPNAAHHALARLEAGGHVRQLVTQNVDGLHARAGSRCVIELHGNVERVACVDCGATVARGEVQQALKAGNPDHPRQPAAAAPDGDADLRDSDVEGFVVPACSRCGGVLKPGVVFFGDTVPPARVDAAMQALCAADALLVLGSSLMLYSGYRFCLAAQRAGMPIGAVNRGRTRADGLLAFKSERACELALVNLITELGLPPCPDT